MDLNDLEMDYHYPPPLVPNNFPELHYTDEKKNITDRIITAQDPVQYFEPLTFNENKICKNLIETNDYIFQGHSQLLDRVTSSPNFPDLIFVASKTHIHAYNRITKTVRSKFDFKIKI